MPPVYAIISFFSYRFFRKYTYYELVEVGMSFPPSQLPLLMNLLSIRGSYWQKKKKSRSFLIKNIATQGSHSQRFPVRSILFHLFVQLTLIIPRLLLIAFVAKTASGKSAASALERKDKRPLIFPVRLHPR